MGRQLQPKIQSRKKTVAVKFNKHNRTIARPLRIDNRKIQYVPTVKYLGLIIDNKLSWKPHINKKLDACTTLMRRLVSKTLGFYGPKPKLMKWTYTGIVSPKLTYGSMIWGTKITHKSFKKKLNVLNRIASTAMTTITRTTPQAALELISYTHPLDLKIKENAMLT